MTKIDTLLADLQKQFGPTKVMRASEIPVGPPISTGSLALDYATGYGGLPSNRVVEIYGRPGVGKTTLALLTMLNALEKYPQRGALFLDVEHKISSDWLEMVVGKDILENRMIYIRPTSIENATNIYRKAVESGDICCAILDSIGGSPTIRRNEDAEVGHYGGNAMGVGEWSRTAGTLSDVYDCFGAETPVITSEGVRSIGDLAGGTYKVLTSTGYWVEAPFKSFGEQPLMKVIVSRHGKQREFYATPTHRWFVNRGRGDQKRVEVLTKDLGLGMRLTSVYGRNKVAKTNPSPFGIARGVVFGDGTRDAHGDCHVDLHGDKNLGLVGYFAGCTLRSIRGEDPCVQVAGLPSYFKDLPPLTETVPYLYGWLAGYFAADGCVSAKGDVILSSSRLTDLEHAQAICQKLGIKTTDVSTQDRKSGFHTSNPFVYFLNIEAESLTEEFFCVPAHRDRWSERMLRQPKERADWRVVSVEETDRVEEVYCAVVPQTESFVLAGNILTGNCLTIGINQVRANMGMGYSDETPGGHQWKHTCVLRIELVKGKDTETIRMPGEEKPVPVGNTVYAKVRKNQVGAPGRTAMWWFYFIPTPEHSFGIDQLDEITRLSIATQVVIQKGGWYYHPALPADKKGEHKVQGLLAFQAMVKQDEALRKTIVSEVLASLSEHGAEVAPMSDPADPIDEDQMSGMLRMRVEGTEDQ